MAIIPAEVQEGLCRLCPEQKGCTGPPQKAGEQNQGCSPAQSCCAHGILLPGSPAKSRKTFEANSTETFLGKSCCGLLQPAKFGLCCLVSTCAVVILQGNALAAVGDVLFLQLLVQ